MLQTTQHRSNLATGCLYLVRSILFPFMLAAYVVSFVVECLLIAWRAGVSAAINMWE